MFFVVHNYCAACDFCLMGLFLVVDAAIVVVLPAQISRFAFL
jgi:hypothetical protein